MLCAVAAVLSYLAIHPAGSGPLFRFENGRALTRQRLVEELRQGLRVMGIDHTKYSGHSFQIGGATTAHAAGIIRYVGLMGIQCSTQVHTNTSREFGNICTATDIVGYL